MWQTSRWYFNLSHSLFKKVTSTTAIMLTIVSQSSWRSTGMSRMYIATMTYPSLGNFWFRYCISSVNLCSAYSTENINLWTFLHIYISASLGGYRTINHENRLHHNLNIYIKSTTCLSFIKPLSSASFNKTYQLSYNRGELLCFIEGCTC
jgi:hypothetical protein